MKSVRRTIQRAAALSCLTILAGCGGNAADEGKTAVPPQSIGVTNPKPDDPLKDVTVENESANMDKIKKAGAIPAKK